MKFFIVDAFTEEVFGGNPAGVVIVEDEFPSEEIMQKTAAELRYSETAFIKKISSTEFKTRFFTPVAEVDLCGHATIASFYSLIKSGLVSDGIYLNKVLAGDLAIEIDAENIFMDMAVPKYFESIKDNKKLKEIYEIMGLEYSLEQLKYKDKELYPELISTGLKDIILVVKDENELNKINVDFQKLSKLSRDYDVVGVHAFTLNSVDGLIHCRNFAPLYDIDEEAATGTSNGALTYFLYRNSLIKNNDETLFIQGEAMNRPSKILSKLLIEDNNVIIKIGGTARILAEGQIQI